MTNTTFGGEEQLILSLDLLTSGKHAMCKKMRVGKTDVLESYAFRWRAQLFAEFGFASSMTHLLYVITMTLTLKVRVWKIEFWAETELLLQNIAGWPTKHMVRQSFFIAESVRCGSMNVNVSASSSSSSSSSGISWSSLLRFQSTYEFLIAKEVSTALFALHHPKQLCRLLDAERHGVHKNC